MTDTQSFLTKYLNWSHILILSSLLAVLWLQAPRLFDPFRIDEDFRNFYWMNRFYDRDLFPDDPFKVYTDVGRLGHDFIWYPASPGYGLLFFLGSFLFTPVLFNKLLPFFVMPLTVWYLFKLGQLAYDRSTGIVLGLGFIFLNLISSTSFSVITGLQRSFACLFIVALVYYLHQHRFVAAAVVIFLSSIIYAPMFILSAAIWGIFALGAIRSGVKSLFVERGLRILFIAGFLGVLSLSSAFFTYFGDFFTPDPATAVETQSAESTATPDNEQLWTDPAYQDDGIVPLFYWFPFIGRGGIVHDDVDGLHLTVLIVFSGIIYLVRGRRSLALPYIIWCILGGSLLSFALSWLAILLTHSFLLYLPSRYTQVGLFLFFFMFVIFNGQTFIRETLLLLQRHHHRLVWLVAGIEVIVLSLITLYPSERTMLNGFNVKWLLGPTGLLFGILGILVIRKSTFTVPDMSTLRQTRGGRLLIAVAIFISLAGWLIYAPIVSQASSLNPSPAERELLRFVETLPKDTLIAGTPCVLGNIPLFAKRQVLFSCEQFAEDQQMREALHAYYTDNRQVVGEFCQAHGIDYLVVDSRFYSDTFLQNGWIFFEPYNQELLPQVTHQENFVLAQVPDEAKLFQSEDIFVVPCSSFLTQQ